MSKRRFTDDEAEQAIRDTECRSIAAVGRKLGCSDKSGSNYDLIKRIAVERNLDTRHWLGQRINTLRKGKPVSDVAQILRIYGPNEPRPGSHAIKLRLIRDGIKKHECEHCTEKTWRGFAIPIELNHKNGNNRDYLLANLEILCPNCHALTSTYSGKNKKFKMAA